VTLLDRLFENVTEHSQAIIAVLLVLTVLVGAGAPMIKQSSSLDQFQSDSPAAKKLNYINSNFTTGNENTTTVQVIAKGDNVLSKGALMNSLQFQQRLRENQIINETLAEDTATSGVANVIAISAIQRQKVAELKASGAELQQRSQRLNRTAAGLSDALNRTRALQVKYDELNASYQSGEVDNESYRTKSATLETQLAQVQAAATANLSTEQSATFNKSAQQARGLQAKLDGLNASYRAGEIDRSTYEQRAGEIRSQFGEVYKLGTRGVLADEYEELGERSEKLQQKRSTLQNGSMPTIAEQLDQLRSMNQSQIDSLTTAVLSDDGGGSGGMASQALAFMPTSYDTGSTEANATMLVIFQKQQSQSAMEGKPPTRSSPPKRESEPSRTRSSTRPSSSGAASSARR
jgi:uncharacterized protein